jgi:acid phosphatase type 7
MNAMSTFGGDDLQWLKQELAASMTEEGIRHRFVVLHFGIASTGPHGANKALRRDVIPLLRDHKVSLVFAGHDHIYERGDLDGVRYVLSGGGGAPLYPVKPDTNGAALAVESVHHFVEVKVDGDALKTSARRTDGSILESCELPQGGPFKCEGAVKWLKSATPPPTTGTTPERPKKRDCSCDLPGRSDGGTPGAGAIALLALGTIVLRRGARPCIRRTGQSTLHPR